MHYRKIVPVLLTLLAFTPLAHADTPPTHANLIYSSSLDSDSDPDIGQLSNRDGQFLTGQGWKATTSNSQLMITLPKGLPLKGTMSVKVTNFDPVTQNIAERQQIINLYSQAIGNHEIFDTHGSWVNIRTGTNYERTSTTAHYKMLAAYDSRREEGRYMEYTTWNLNNTYEFTIVWDENSIWTIVDGVVQGEIAMTGDPLEKFRYIFLGTDNQYVAQPGPIYTDLRIYTNDYFTDITSQAGVAGESPASGWFGHGVNFSDFDKDGYLDLMTSHAGGAARDEIFFLNNGNSTFSEVTSARNILDNGNTHGVVSADWDNDGDLDVFMTNQPVGSTLPPGRNRMYRNDNGYFTEITDQAGIANEYYFSRGGVALDINNDGWLDLYVLNWGDPNALYLNDGTGKFNKVDRGTNGPTVDDAGRQGVTAGDIDNDGDIDIYVCRRDAVNWLFINDGNGNFAEEATIRNVAGSSAIRSHGAVFVDIDNDADMDIFVMNYAQGDANPDIPLMYAFINNGNGTFTDRTLQYNIRSSGYSLIFGDIDNDADQDLYLIRNDEKEPGTVPEIYLNDGNGNLSRQAIEGAGVAAGAARGAGFGDIDNDGDLDVYIACVESDNFLLRNDFNNNNNHLDVLCIGPGGDYGGYGTKVSVYQPGHLGNNEYLLGYQEAVTTVAYMCQNQTALHFGLGDFQECDVRVEFTNGQVDDYYSISANQTMEATANPPIPTTMQRISSNVLEGPAGQMFPDSVKVKVLNDKDYGVSNHTVSFTITGGNGTLNGRTQTTLETSTNQLGYATVAWYAGTNTNIANSLSVQSQYEGSPLANSPMNFSGVINPGPDSLITKVSGDVQNAAPSSPLPDSIRVKVHDSYENAHAGVYVNFQVISGNGNIDGSVSKIVQTNQQGIAAVQWTLGNVQGDNAHSLKASLVSTPQAAVTFTASTAVAPIKELLYVSGNGQSGTVGQALAAPMVVQLKDDLGNPRGGYDITFKVTSGGGNLAGATQQQITTDITGKAAATLTLGKAAGTDINIVEAFYGDLEKLTFTATGTADVATQILKSSGDHQTAGVGQTVPLPLSVLVTDQFSNPVPGHNVVFTVNNNQGRVNNKLTDTVPTNSQGMAQVAYQLGDVPGTYTVNVTATQNNNPLTGSPLVFSASATSEPSMLVKISGDSATGIINQPLALPLQVKVSDENGYPVANYPVTFVSESGGGTFEGNLQIQQLTSEQGIASVYPTLAERVGPYVYAFSAKAYNTDGQHLQGSPISFHISAKSTRAEKIALISGDLQSGQAGEFLDSQIQVIVQDNENNPIQNQNVQFKVTKGSGKLGTNQLTTTTIKSGANGVARISFKLGSEIGDSAHVVQVSSTDGIKPLGNSPIKVYAHAKYGQPDPTKSNLIISDSIIPADGVSELLVSVQLYDQLGQPVPGEQIVLHATGDDNTIEQPASVTNENGMASGRITSTRAEQKDISVTMAGKDIVLDDVKTVQFIAGTAHSINIVSGNNQTGTINSALQAPLVVQVNDEMGNPIRDHQVTFQIATGGGSIQPVQPVNTDSTGQAKASWILGSNVGSQTVTATAQNITTPVTFTATGQMPGSAFITKSKGDGQFASPGNLFSDSLTVKITDENSKPISGIPVKYRIDQGDASFIGISTVNSDSYGFARIQLVAGNLLGTIRVNASINDDQSVDFTSTVSSSLPDSMLHVFGNGSQGTVGTTIFPLTVQVLDNNNNPISGVPINFTSDNPDASVTDEQPLFTASNGQASAHVRLGTASGPYRFMASNANLKNSPIIFDLVALPDNAENLIKIQGSGQSGNPLETLPEALQVKIIDQFGNGIPDIQANFQVTSGGGSITEAQPSITDEQGIASAQWQLGQSGTQQVTVTSNVLTGKSVTFTAELLANGLPVITTVTDTSITETQTLVFNVNAVDPEGTNVTLTVQDLPQGAEFDAQETGQFSWTPGYTDQGDYAIKFIAEDENAGKSEQIVQIHVVNVNRRPVIQSTMPEQTVLSTEYNKLAAFTVKAVDADNDRLYYRWYVDGSLVRAQNDSDFIYIQPNEIWPLQFNVDVLITDLIDTTNHTWTVNIATFIELASFQASTTKDLVTINWETSNESGTAGFNILRSNSENGTFTAVNENLILPDKSCQYEYQEKLSNKNQVYYYCLQEVDLQGRTQTFDAVRVQIALPATNRLLQNYPNPFNPTTNIQYELAKPQHIEIKIYNLTGQMIRNLYTGSQKAGYHQLIWDSKNDLGSPVSSGIYYCCMTGNGYRNTIKLLLLK